MRASSMTVALLATLSLAHYSQEVSKEVKGEKGDVGEKGEPGPAGRKATKVIRAIRAIRGHRAQPSGLWQRSRRRPRARPTK
jgi:hypothetical protein